MVCGIRRFDEGSARDRELLRKGANLAEMARLGLSGPPGFTVRTEACRFYWPPGSRPRARGRAAGGAHRSGGGDRPRLGDPGDPLLLSVRSGAPVSMPGMMDTVFNLGLTPVR